MASLSLPAVIDTASVGAVRNLLAEHRGAPLEIDASAVERIGGLGLQVLLSAIRTWNADEQPVAIINATPAFNDLLRLTGAASLPEFTS